MRISDWSSDVCSSDLQRDTVSVDFYREVFHVTHFPGDSGNDLNTLSVSAAAGGRRRPTGPTLRSCMRFPSFAAPNPHIPSGHQAAEGTARMRPMPPAHFPAAISSSAFRTILAG